MVELKMPDINNVLIAGNLTCDPSFRKTTNGTPVANFYIASNRKFRDNNGQWRENVCYVGVVAWYKLAESCYENLKRGSAIIVDGELQSRTWRNEDGSSRNVVEIKARRIQFLNRRIHSEPELNTDDLTGSDMAEEETETYVNEEQTEQTSNDSSNNNEPNSQKSVVKNETYNNIDFDFGYQNLNF